MKLWQKISFITVLAGLLAGCSPQSKQQQTTTSTSSKTTNTEQLAQLDYQSGQSAVVQVNHGKSTLNASDWQTNKVHYSNLDQLNRTSSPNTAYLERRNIASGALRVRQYVKPTGWHQKFADGAAIVNRGHLIAYSISKGIATSGKYNPNDVAGDQNNPKNLFTQTAFANQKVQTIYESKIRTALMHNQKVIYQAQAVFRGQELMARGVHLQAISTDGSLNFNVYIHNVQPRYQFDYSNGTSKVDQSLSVPTPAGAPNFNNQRNNNQHRYSQRHQHHHYQRYY